MKTVHHLPPAGFLRTLTFCIFCYVPAAYAQNPYNLATDSIVYEIAGAHLDDQWQWTLNNTISDYLPNTMRSNFALLAAYPEYNFSFEGAYRYWLMKKFYPTDYATLKSWVAKDRWNYAGTFWDPCDVNIPSAEALIRQSLYGTEFSMDEFGKRSVDVYLPDCFGFGYALPTIARHCGLMGFSTQKYDLLAWGWHGWTPAPFAIGRWIGVDGSSIVASIKPGNYSSGMDIRTADGAYGLSILNDCKYGWNKESRSKLNLTLLHSPTATAYDYQQDQSNVNFVGIHRFTYSFYGHANSWTNGTVRQAACLNQPVYAFQPTARAGARNAREISFVQTRSPQVMVMAIKKAEKSDRYVVRVREANGASVTGAKLTFGADITSAVEMNGVEDIITSPSPITTSGADLTFNLTKYQPRTFAVSIAGSPEVMIGHQSRHAKRSKAIERSLKLRVNFLSGNDQTIRLFDLSGRTIASRSVPPHHRVLFGQAGPCLYQIKAGNSVVENGMVMLP